MSPTQADHAYGRSHTPGVLNTGWEGTCFAPALPCPPAPAGTQLQFAHTGQGVETCFWEDLELPSHFQPGLTHGTLHLRSHVLLCPSSVSRVPSPLGAGTAPPLSPARQAPVGLLLYDSIFISLTCLQNPSDFTRCGPEPDTHHTELPEQGEVRAKPPAAQEPTLDTPGC